MNRPESLRDEIATIIQAGKVEGNAASDTADAVMVLLFKAKLHQVYGIITKRKP